MMTAIVVLSIICFALIVGTLYILLELYDMKSKIERLNKRMEIEVPFNHKALTYLDESLAKLEETIKKKYEQ